MNLKPTVFFQIITTILADRSGYFPFPSCRNPSCVAKWTPSNLLRFKCRSAKDRCLRAGKGIKKTSNLSVFIFLGRFPPQHTHAGETPCRFYLSKESSLTSAGVAHCGYRASWCLPDGSAISVRFLPRIPGHKHRWDRPRFRAILQN